MKTLDTVNPRVPAPWQSAQGEADPKARPQRRSRWTAGEDSGPARTTFDPGEGHWNEGGAALWMAVERCRGYSPRDRTARGGACPDSSLLESTGEKSSPWGVVRCVRTVNRHRWARRAASGERVKRGQGTRHNDPVTSEEGMSEPVTCTMKLVRIAANRPKRLFSKNTGVCQAAQGAVYTLTPARCRKVKGRA